MIGMVSDKNLLNRSKAVRNDLKDQKHMRFANSRAAAEPSAAMRWSCHSKGVELTPLAHIHFSHQHSALPGACPGAQSFTISQGLPAAQPASCAAPAASFAEPHTTPDVLPDFACNPALLPTRQAAGAF